MTRLKFSIRLLLCIALVVGIKNVKAQVITIGNVSGIVKDEKTALEGATIFLYKAKDSVLVKTAVTNNEGSFTFEQIPLQTYFITINYAGYQKYTTATFGLTNQLPNLVLVTIVLTKLTDELGNVVVTSKRNFIEKKIDRTIVNPDVLISNAGATALEVLEKSPGIQVNTDGLISLKGRQGVMVFIDDKPTNMGGTDLAAYLRSLPASTIDFIEIMTNPPAKYDAAGNAGIINIRMKKNIAKGFNGGINIGYGQGVYSRSNNSINFNYRINKINFFSNLSYSRNNIFQDLFINRTYANNAGVRTSAFNQFSFIKKQPTSFNVKMGMDYYANKKSTFGIVLTGFDNRNIESVANKAEILDGNMALQNRVAAFSTTNRQWNNKGINTNYTYAFNTKGKQLLVNADYVSYNSIQNNGLLNSVFRLDGSLDNKTNLLSNLPATIDIASAKIDYTQPFDNGGRFETGAKTSFINTDNIAAFSDEAAGIITPNITFSNNFRYKENINAAYVNYALQKGKLGMQLGLRFENTNIEGKQYNNVARPDSVFTRVFNNFFPTGYLSYQIDSIGNHQLGFSFGKRINRPDYQSMNPFTYPLDRYTLYSGNPFLQPTFSYYGEVSYTYKNNITTEFSYGYTKDVISETIQQENNIFYSRPGNIGKQVSFSLSVSGMIPVKKWWKIQLYTEVTHNKFTAQLYNQNLNNQGAYWFISPTNLFQISKKWSAELGGNYQTSVYAGQFVTIPQGQVRFAVAKKVLKDKGTVKLGMNDIFYTFQPGGDIKALGNSTASWKSFLDTRIINLSFSYRFNKGKSLNARDTKSADEEKSRVKAG